MRSIFGQFLCLETLNGTDISKCVRYQHCWFNRYLSVFSLIPDILANWLKRWGTLQGGFTPWRPWWPWRWPWRWWGGASQGRDRGGASHTLQPLGHQDLRKHFEKMFWPSATISFVDWIHHDLIVLIEYALQGYCCHTYGAVVANPLSRVFPHHWRHKRAHLSFPKEVFTKYGCRKLVVALVEKKERNGVSWAGEGEGPSSGEVR